MARTGDCLPLAAGVRRRVTQRSKNRWSPELAGLTLYAMKEPQRQIRAAHTDSTITVYQAYRPEIGGPAAREGRFPAAWKPDRMTWIIKQRSQTFAAMRPVGGAGGCAPVARQELRWARSSSPAGYSCSWGSSRVAASSSPSLTRAWISWASGVTSLMDTIHSSA